MSKGTKRRKEECSVWRCTPVWPWDRNEWETASSEVSVSVWVEVEAFLVSLLVKLQ